MSEAPSFPEFLWIWNDGQGQETPELHIRIARWLADEDNGNRKLLLAFRNAGKSTIVGLYCAWLLLTDPGLRLLVLATDMALARKMVRNVKRVIERHPLTAHLVPARADQWAADQFTVAREAEWRDPSMLARSVLTNMTGSRADVVICDDVEVPKTCDTAPKREALRERLQEIDYVLVPGGRQLYIGTPHSYYSIYAAAPRPDAGEETPFLDGFDRLAIPLLDGTGTSAWPERFTDEKIEAIRRRTGPNKFKSQMLLEPVNVSDSRLDPDRLVPYEHELRYEERNGQPMLLLGKARLVSASAWWDPAYGRPEAGDASTLAIVFTDEAGGYWLHDIDYLVHDPAQAADVDEATQLCRQAAAFAERNFVPALTVETNGLGRFLPGLLRREMGRAGVPCAVLQKASSRSKDLRILEAFDPVLAAGALHAHRRVWDTPFIAEMRDWRPRHRGSQGHAPGERGLSPRALPDDGLDAVAGCLLSEPVRLARTPRPAHPSAARHSWQGSARRWRARTDFDL